MKKWIILVVGVILVAAVATAVALQYPRGRSLSDLQKSGILRIGYAVEAPYAFLDASGGVIGESPEIAGYVADQLGIPQTRYVLTEFGSLVSGLEAGRYDVIAAGMFITEERAKEVAFSEPTFRVRQGLLVPQGNPLGLHSYEATVSNPQVRVAAVSGAVEEKLLRQLGLPDSRLVSVPEALAGVRAVESGVADALALSSPTFRWMSLSGQLGTTSIAEPFQQPDTVAAKYLGFGGFAFRKSDERLREAWNAVLRSYVGSSEHIELLGRYGMSENELPGNVTTQQILSAE